MTFRDQERKKYHVVGGSCSRAAQEARMPNRPATAPIRRPRRVKTPPKPAVPCVVKDSAGVPYDYDPERRILYRNLLQSHLFSSRSKASGAVWRTIQTLKQAGFVWEGKEFIIENAG